jgi:hypothetical protein
MKIQGMPVEDANDKLEIAINKTDIRLGAKKDSNSCAAARALCRQHHAEAAMVHFSRAYIKKNGKWLRYSVPTALRNEVLAFDRGGAFEPGEYVLAPVQPTVRLDASVRKRYEKKTKRKLPQNGARAKRPYHVVTGVRKRMVADWE